METYKSYWEEWHREWFQKRNNKAINEIKKWEIPKGTGGNENAIRNYFPEPYLGNPSSKVKAIFININPGMGGPDQDVDNEAKSGLYKIYQSKHYSYSQTIQDVLGDNKNRTAKWFNKRVKWTKSLLGEDIRKDHILCADLIPWHTKKESGIQGYLTNKNNRYVILNKIVKPLIKASKRIDKGLINKIIIRGVAFVDLLNNLDEPKKEKEDGKINKRKDRIQQYVVLDTNKALHKFNSYLAVITYGGIKLYIFSGGANMELPNVNYKVYPVNNSTEKPLKLKDFLNA